MPGELLGSEGHEVTAFDRPEAALEGSDESAPNLALIDFAMAGMNGARLARELRRRKPNFPIVFVTGYAESERLEGARSDVPFLRKPFRTDELVSLVVKSLERTRPSQA